MDITKAQYSIAVVEDNKDHAVKLQSILESAGYRCTIFNRPQDFKIAPVVKLFDVILVDWYLGCDESGLDVISWLKREVCTTPLILLITARNDENAVVQALDDGADDFMSKPVKPKELLARIDALVRRRRGAIQEVFKEYFPYRLNMTTKTITYNGNPVALREKEFDLIAFMFANPGRVLSREEILTAVWGTGENSRTVDTHASRVRKKLSLVGNPYWKLTCVYRKGYRMQNLTPGMSGIPAMGINTPTSFVFK